MCEIKQPSENHLPRWAFRLLAVLWYVDAVVLCVEPFLPDGPVKVALYATGVAVWLPLLWPLAKTMGGNAFRFQQSLKSAREVAQTDIGKMLRATHGCLFPRREDGFSTGFLVIYYVGMVFFAMACIAHPVLLMAPWKRR